MPKEFRFHSTPGGRISGRLVAVRCLDSTLWIELDALLRTKARMLGTETIVVEAPRHGSITIARARDVIPLLPDGTSPEVRSTFADLARACNAKL